MYGHGRAAWGADPRMAYVMRTISEANSSVSEFSVFLERVERGHLEN